jgi:hypothetical protein
MATSGPATGQFLRSASLVVTKGTAPGSPGLDLSNLRFRFEVRASDAETPNTMTVRVYNLAQTTVNSIIQEFDTVILTAGYQTGNKGTIFQGDIKQFRFGRERNVDSYLDIFAGDGDQAYNEKIINQSFPAGTTDSQSLSAIAASMGLPVANTADGFLTTGGILPRGKTQFGMARVFMRDLARNNDTRWSIQNGVLTLIPNTGFLPGQIVQLNSATGMIGTPEQTDNGIMIRCLLNPLIKIGQAVQINNADINQATIKSQFFPSYTSQYYPATIANDGIYRVLVAEHVGDTRGSEWATELTCLVINQSPTAATPSSASQSVLPTG